jgi:hypothetical protein
VRVCRIERDPKEHEACIRIGSFGFGTGKLADRAVDADA